MKIQSTSDRLKEIMSTRNLRQVDILNLAKPYCEKFNIKLGRNDLSQYVNGKVDPGQEKLTILGLALDVSETWLMGYDVPMNRLTPSSSLRSEILPLPQTRKLPLVGNIACGKPILAVEDADEVVSVPEDIQADFALRCKGDSMINARIFDGDLVYIKQQPSVENGQIAAVRIGEEATLKKVYYAQDSARVTLRACNPLYPDMVYEGESLNDIDVLGLAVGFFSLVIHE